MKWFKRKPKYPPLTGNVIDMTRTMWGHNISMTDGPDDNGVWRGFIWHSHGANVGDELTWKNKAGIVKSIITDVEKTPGVWDMYLVAGVITHLDGKRINV